MSRHAAALETYGAANLVLTRVFVGALPKGGFGLAEEDIRRNRQHCIVSVHEDPGRLSCPRRPLRVRARPHITPNSGKWRRPRRIDRSEVGLGPTQQTLTKT